MSINSNLNQVPANQNPLEPGQSVNAGARPLLQNDPGVAGIIDLDIAHASDDPSTAVLSLVAEKAGCTVAELATKGGFNIEKGFRPPDLGKDKPIPMFAYSNPPGPDCYYLVRHWKVTVNGADGHPKEMLFSKKIYTSVEVPRNLDGPHKQQQYIAALAASTYAHIEESRIALGATGTKNELYKQVEDHITKIARDRFVTLEMFNNDKNVAINPSKKTKVGEDVIVHTVRLKFRGAKMDRKDETKMEGFPEIVLTNDNKFNELKEKKYIFLAENNSSPLARQTAAALNRKEALDEIMKAKNDDVNVDPKKVFEDRGLTLGQVKGAVKGEITTTVGSFYSHQAFFGDQKSVKSLMSHDPSKFQLSQPLLDKIAPEEKSTLLQKMGISKEKKPEDFSVLKNLENKIDELSLAEKKEAGMLLEATSKVYLKMLDEDKSITLLENELELMGEKRPSEHQTKRYNVLKEMVTLIATLRPLLPLPDQIAQNPVPSDVDNQVIEENEELVDDNPIERPGFDDDLGDPHELPPSGLPPEYPPNSNVNLPPPISPNQNNVAPDDNPSGGDNI